MPAGRLKVLSKGSPNWDRARSMTDRFSLLPATWRMTLKAFQMGAAPVTPELPFMGRLSGLPAQTPTARYGV